MGLKHIETIHFQDIEQRASGSSGYASVGQKKEFNLCDWLIKHRYLAKDGSFRRFDTEFLHGF